MILVKNADLNLEPVPRQSDVLPISHHNLINVISNYVFFNPQKCVALVYQNKKSSEVHFQVGKIVQSKKRRR